MNKINKNFIKSSHYISDLKLCSVRLIDNQQFPWIILIPKRKEITDITELNYEESKKILDNAKNNVKVAIVMELKDLSYSKSLYRLKKYKGNLRDALK